MTGPRQPSDAPSSAPDDEGVRVIRRPSQRPGMAARIAASVGLGAAVAVGVSSWWSAEPPAAVNAGAASSAAAAPRVEPAATAAPAAAAPPGATATAPFAAIDDPALRIGAPHGDPNDLASYIRPGDPVPDMANVIRALNDAGIREGIGAFNPPGTRPPLAGIAVPAGFELPPGYVRHHQSHDDGTPIEPILMFSPDVVLRDAQGRVIPLPEDRVVPPDMVPPGLPIRWVRPGKT